MQPPVAASPATARRSTASAVLFGVAVAVAGALVAGCLLTIPVFALGRFTEPAHATGRPWFESGIRWAFVVGAVVGAASGAGLGRWYARGGPWPGAGGGSSASPYEETT